MRSLELGNKRGDDLAFATHSPEADHGLVCRARAAASGEENEPDRDQADDRSPPRERGAATYCAEDSQPPEKPARSRPRLRCGFFFMTRQTSALRWFSIIAQMGP